MIVLAYDREAAMRLTKTLPASKIFLKSYLPIDEVEIAQARGLSGLIIDAKNGIPDEFLTRVHSEDLELITFAHNSDLGRWHLWKQLWQGVDYVLTTRPDWVKQKPL